MTLRARYRTACAVCPRAIERGEEIEQDSNSDWMHVECAEQDDQVGKRPDNLCSKCFMVRPCEHDD